MYDLLEMGCAIRRLHHNANSEASMVATRGSTLDAARQRKFPSPLGALKI